MGSIYDIASSAVRAHKDALSSTSQNIANVDTDGYTRREVKLEEVSAKNDGLAAKGASVGLGVKVDQVRRAYDEVLAAQLRKIGSKFQSSQAFVANLEKLENYLLPDGNLIDSINSFFSRLSDVAAEPGSQANRVSAISFGNEVAAAFSRTSESLGFLEAQIDQETEFTINRVNELSAQIAKINKDISASFSSKGATPALLDIRDKLLVDLGELAAISVTTKDTGEVRVDLGFDAVGSVLVDGEKNSALSYKLTDSGLYFFSNQTQPLTGFDAGLLRGVSDSLDVLRRTEKELDALTKRFVNELNSQHRQGIDLNGNEGKPLFSSSIHELTGLNYDRSQLSVNVIKIDGYSDKYGDIFFKYDGLSDQWSARHEGKILAGGRDELIFDGFTVRFQGPAKDGNSFSLSRKFGDAENLKFLLDDPTSLAATAPLIIDPAAENTGTAAAKISAVETNRKGETSILENFQNNLSPISSKTFLKGGKVGIIPKTTEQLTISSNAEQSSVVFVSKNFEKTSRIDVSLDGQQYTLTVPTGASDLNVSGATDLANYFNSGLLRFQNNLGQSFDSEGLGTLAVGSGDTLKFVSSYKEINSGQAVIDGTAVSGSITASNDASNIFVFTREGRQLAGRALGATEIDSLINQENGFSEFATYSSEYLSPASGKGYRGVIADTILANSGHSLAFGISGGGTGISSVPLVNSQVGSVNFFDEQTLIFSSPTLGLAETVVVPSNASAKSVADVLNEALSPKGLQFTAENRVQIELDATTGNPISFELIGKNNQPLLIDAEYNSTIGLKGLAQSLNTMSPTTGITAQVSSDSNRLVLIRADGGDIAVSNVRNANLSLQALDGNFDTLGNSAALTPSVTNSLVFSGLVTVNSDATLSLSSAQGTNLTSAKNNYLSSAVSRQLTDAGDTARFEFHDIPTVDGNASEGTSALVYQGGHKVTLAITKEDNSIDTFVTRSSALESGSGLELSQDLIAKARAVAPIPRMESGVFASLPPEGAQMKFTYAGEEYVLKYLQGEFQIDGRDSGQFVVDLTQTNQGYTLSINNPKGSVSGSPLVPLADNGEEQFGFNTWTNVLTGKTPQAMNIGSTLTATIKISEQANVTVTLQRLNNGTYQLTSSDASITAVFSSGANTSTSLTPITLKNTDPSADLDLTGGAAATAMGFDMAREEIFLDGADILIRSLNGQPSDAKITSERDQNNNLLSMKNLPGEDLIVLISNDGAKRVSMTHEVSKAEEKTLEKTNLSLKLTNSMSGTIGIFDTLTDQLLGERKLNDGRPINVYDFTITIAGSMEEGDAFSIISNDKLELNGHNLDILAQLGVSTSDRLSYQDSYRNYLVDVGSRLSANRIELESVSAQLEAAKAKVDEKSGVNLDTEAANLIQQQQSYQAAARLLQTARDMFDTIVKI